MSILKAIENLANEAKLISDKQVAIKMPEDVFSKLCNETEGLTYFTPGIYNDNCIPTDSLRLDFNVSSIVIIPSLL